MNPIEVLGIGSPCIDHIIPVTEEFMQSIPGGRGGMIPVNYEDFQRIMAMAGPRASLNTGGSGANTIKGLANLGHHCALIGKIGNDDAGINFKKNLESLGVQPYLISSTLHTSQIACLVTPDGERTFRDFFGAGQQIQAEDLNEEFFHGVKLVHIEGYTILNENLTLRAMQLAKKHGAKVSFDLASFELATNYRPELVKLLSQHVDILFANELETRSLTGLGPERGCGLLRDLCDIAVVLVGKDGCWVGSPLEVAHYPAYPVNPLDTTGAGDLFAAGFLHGYLTGMPLKDAAHFGALAAAEVIQVYGAEIPNAVWNHLRQKIEEKKPGKR